MMKIALVYDWVTTRYGGAEKTLQALHLAFPDAPLFTALYDPQTAAWAADFQVIPSFINQVPQLAQHHRWSAPLLPLAFESLDLSEYDVVISVTSAMAKGVLTRADQLHLSYILTPPRFLYADDRYAQEQLRFPGSRTLTQPLWSYLRWWDQAAAYRPDQLIAISELVAQRCQETYGRSAEVVYPPVEVAPRRADTSQPGEATYLAISRLVPYKRLDSAIQACIQLQRPLTIIGEGPDSNRLRSLAQGNPLITFLGSQPDQVVTEQLSRARAVLMPGLEDFGISACEAVAQGTPVILHRQSGAAELVTDGKTGILLEADTPAAVIAAIQKLEENQFNPSQLRQSMQKYATTSFVENWQNLVNKSWDQFQQNLERLL